MPERNYKFYHYAFGDQHYWLRERAMMSVPSGVYYYPHVALKYATGTVLYVYNGDELIHSRDVEHFLRTYFNLPHDLPISEVLRAASRMRDISVPHFNARILGAIHDASI